jgi:hypothetical protein
MANDPELIALQERWSPSWRIWRNHVDGGVRKGSYCARRVDEKAGVKPFLMARSPRALEASLEANAAAMAGEKYEPADLEPGLMA